LAVAPELPAAAGFETVLLSLEPACDIDHADAMLIASVKQETDTQSAALL
jgi:hypothetical protein